MGTHSEFGNRHTPERGHPPKMWHRHERVARETESGPLPLLLVDYCRISRQCSIKVFLHLCNRSSFPPCNCIFLERLNHAIRYEDPSRNGLNTEEVAPGPLRGIYVSACICHLRVVGQPATWADS